MLGLFLPWLSDHRHAYLCKKCELRDLQGIVDYLKCYSKESVNSFSKGWKWLLQNSGESIPTALSFWNFPDLFHYIPAPQELETPKHVRKNWIYFQWTLRAYILLKMQTFTLSIARDIWPSEVHLPQRVFLHGPWELEVFHIMYRWWQRAWPWNDIS